MKREAEEAELQKQEKARRAQLERKSAEADEKRRCCCWGLEEAPGIHAISIGSCCTAQESATISSCTAVDTAQLTLQHCTLLAVDNLFK